MRLPFLLKGHTTHEFALPGNLYVIIPSDLSRRDHQVRCIVGEVRIPDKFMVSRFQPTRPYVTARGNRQLVIVPCSAKTDETSTRRTSHLCQSPTAADNVRVVSISSEVRRMWKNPAARDPTI